MSPSPWPQPTPPPKRRKSTRQVIADQTEVDQAEVNCQLNSGNNVYSCFPTADTVVDQSQWASFVWNSRRPELTQTNLVDVYLFRADSQAQILHYHDLVNPTDQAGLLRTQVNDTWFGSDGTKFNGTAQSFPYYWVITRNDSTLDGNQVPQPVFTAVQTTVLDSVASSSAAAASSAALAASLAASLSRLSASETATRSPSPTSTGNVQLLSSGSAFPHWGIAVIVILGFLAIAATCLLAFLILRRVRRRRHLDTTSRNSVGSASPMIMNRNNTEGEMIQHYESPAPPLLPPSTAAAFAATTGDNASSISDSGGPFSGADAAIMADAFRKMLRKPDFAGRPVEEGDSPSDVVDNDTEPGPGNIVISRELAEEGKDIRSVSSSRGVKVEGAEPR